MRSNSRKKEKKGGKEGKGAKPKYCNRGSKWLCNGRAFSFEGACMLAFPLTNLRDGH